MYLSDELEPGEGDGRAGFSIATSEYQRGSGERTVEVQPLSEAKIELVLEPTHYAQQMACTVMCGLSGTDTFDDALTFLAGDVGMRVPSDFGVGTSLWSRKDGDATMLSLARCGKRIFEDIAVYTLELDVVTSEGCTQTAISAVHSIATYLDDHVELPCEDIRELGPDDFPSSP